MQKKKLEMQIGNRTFAVGEHTYVMGIINMTPDSFYDKSRANSVFWALKHADKMIEQGVDIIDVGGESTRPGYQMVDEEEEIRRTSLLVRELKKLGVPVSIDTYKSKVALAALEVGADLVNDIWGLKYDPSLAGLIAEFDAACCLMHNRKRAEYKDFMGEMKAELKESLEIAKNAGIADDKIILDPGIGFGKIYEHNLEAIYKLGELKELGYPILLGASRKSVIGITMNLPVQERLEGTLATTVVGVMAGCSFVRVHDVLENKRVIQMAEAVRSGWQLMGEESSEEDE